MEWNRIEWSETKLVLKWLISYLFRYIFISWWMKQKIPLSVSELKLSILESVFLLSAPLPFLQCRQVTLVYFLIEKALLLMKTEYFQSMWFFFNNSAKILKSNTLLEPLQTSLMFYQHGFSKPWTTTREYPQECKVEIFSHSSGKHRSPHFLGTFQNLLEMGKVTAGPAFRAVWFFRIMWSFRLVWCTHNQPSLVLKIT